MSYGFKTIGDSGAWQIDGTAPNLSLVATGSSFFTESYYPLNYTTNGVPYSTKNNFKKITVSGLTTPIFATEGTAAIAAIEVSGSTYTWWVYGIEGGGFSYFIFDTVPPNQTGYGMKIWNEAGAVIYTGATKPLRVVNRFTIDYAGSLTTSRSWGPFTDTQVRRLAFVQVAPAPAKYRREYGYFHPTATVWFRGTWTQFAPSMFNPIAFGFSNPSQSNSASDEMGFVDIDTGQDPPGIAPNTAGTYTEELYGNWDYWVVDITDY